MMRQWFDDLSDRELFARLVQRGIVNSSAGYMVANRDEPEVRQSIMHELDSRAERI